MAKGDQVPGHENVIRFIDEEDWDGKRVNGAAFERPLKDDDGVSLNRLRVFDQKNRDRDLAQVKAVMLCRRVPLSNGLLAEIAVQAIEAVGVRYSLPILVIEDPKPRKGAKLLANPAHALIVETPFQGGALADAVADRIGKAVHAIISTSLP
jgi:hypothetical protein